MAITYFISYKTVWTFQARPTTDGKGLPTADATGEPNPRCFITATNMYPRPLQPVTVHISKPHDDHCFSGWLLPASISPVTEVTGSLHLPKLIKSLD